MRHDFWFEFSKQQLKIYKHQKYVLNRRNFNLKCKEIEVIKYYLKWELKNIILSDYEYEKAISCLNKKIDEMPDGFATMLMMLISSPFSKNNSVYFYLGNRQCEWSLESIDTNKLLLPRINKKVDPTLNRFGRNLSKFTDFLRNEGLEQESMSEFRDDGKNIYYDALIGIEKGRYIKIIDGSHRAVILALRGLTELKIYTGRRKHRISHSMYSAVPRLFFLLMKKTQLHIDDATSA